MALRIYKYKTEAMDRHHSPSECFPSSHDLGTIKKGQFVVQKTAANGQWRNVKGPFNSSEVAIKVAELLVLND